MNKQFNDYKWLISIKMFNFSSKQTYVNENKTFSFYQFIKVLNF